MSRLHVQNLAGYGPRYHLPMPTNIGTAGITGDLPGFIPTDGFWHPEGRHYIAMGAGNATVYLYNSITDVFTRHQQFLGGQPRGAINRVGDRIAGVTANNLQVLAFDPVTGNLSADVILTDTARFSHARSCAWDPTGEFIAVANETDSSPFSQISIIRYVRSPASLTVVAERIGVFGESRLSVDWSRQDIIVASGLQLGIWMMTFDRVTNALTLVSRTGGVRSPLAVAFDSTGEFLAELRTDGIGTHGMSIWRYTPSPHSLTLLVNVFPPAGAGGIWYQTAVPRGKVSWDWTSRFIFTNKGIGTVTSNLGIFEFDPVTFGLRLWRTFAHHPVIDTMIIHPHGNLLAVSRRVNETPYVMGLPWSSRVIN